MFDSNSLAALVASRICHDLISPIGAIGNGVELMLMEASASMGQEMALIRESATSANARIRFFRVAFGLCALDQRINLAEVNAILADVQTGSRLHIAWTSPPDMARRDVKMAFLGILCMESALIQGGQITAKLTDQGWHIQGRAPRIRHDAALWDGLANPAIADWRDISAGQVHFALLAQEAARQHRDIMVMGSAAAEMLELRF